MVDGLWIVQYVGLAGNDSGAVVLVNGSVLGGDNGWVYRGKYKLTETGLSATIYVHNFNPAVPSILGIKGDYTVSAQLRFMTSDILQGNATIFDPPSPGIVLKLTRYCGL